VNWFYLAQGEVRYCSFGFLKR